MFLRNERHEAPVSLTHESQPRAHGRLDRQSLETLFGDFTKAVLVNKHVRGCSRCAGPMVQQNASLVCLECSNEEELETA